MSAEHTNQLFATVVDATYPALLRLARRLVSDPEQAKDSVQEALLHVWQLGVTENRPRKLRSLLLAAVAKQCKAEADASPLPSPATRVVQRLSASDRQMLELHFLKGLSIAETARVLNLPREQLYKRIRRELFHLKQLLSAEGALQFYSGC